MCCQSHSVNAVDILMVIGTFLAVIVALFGDVLQQKWFGPKLSLSLEKKFGDLNIRNDGKPAYYFHLVAENHRKAIANNAIVLLTRIEEYRDSRKCAIWNGEVPLRWIYQEYYGSYSRNIGSEQICDLISVTRGELQLMVMFPPNNMPEPWTNECNLYLTAIVKSDEAVSTPVTIHIVWDGLWDTEADIMKTHLSLIVE